MDPKDYFTEPRDQAVVFILGAGSSFGSTLRSRPPIMRDFIRVGKNVAEYDYSPLWDLLNKIGFSKEMLDKGTPNLEELYGILEVMSSGLWHRYQKAFVQEYGEAFWKVPPVYFLQSFIIDVLRKPSSRALINTCKRHDFIVKMMSKGDSIISFNYDLIIDSSLFNSGLWGEIGGYGRFNWDMAFEELDYPNAKTITSSKYNLFKPHGSLNWSINSETNTPQTIPSLGFNNNNDSLKIYEPTLRQKLTGKQGDSIKKTIKIRQLNKIKKIGVGTKGMAIKTYLFYEDLKRTVPEEDVSGFEGPQKPSESLSLYIAPPTLNKFGEKDLPEDMIEIWINMRVALSKAKKIICIGYSFPDTDVEFNTLFRIATHNNPNPDLQIEIVNPDNSVVEKIKNLIPNRKVTKVSNTLKDYVGF